MKIVSFLAALLLSSHAFAQVQAQGAAAPAPATVAVLPPSGTDLTILPRSERDTATVSLSRVTVADLLALVYGEVFKAPYVLHPSVVADTRVISTRIDVSRKSRTHLRVLFDSLDLVVESRQGVDYIKLKEVPHDRETEVFLYLPQYRDSSYLADLLRGVFSGSFTINRPVAGGGAAVPSVPPPAGSAAALVDSKGNDVLVFSGPAREVAMLKKLLPQVDIRQGEVLLRGTVYEVSRSSADGNGFALALNILSSRLAINIGAPAPGQNTVSISTGSIDAVVSALSSDGRFKTVSSPSLRVRSGASGKFSVGQDVPVLGSVSYVQGSSTPVQSVEYRSSGVIFDVKPVVHRQIIDLDIGQQISSFAQTSTGVNASPTLVKREIKTSLSMRDGEIVVIGGLTDEKLTEAKSGLPFLPRWTHSRNGDSSNTDVLLVLQVHRIDVDDQGDQQESAAKKR